MSLDACLGRDKHDIASEHDGNTVLIWNRRAPDGTPYQIIVTNIDGRVHVERRLPIDPITFKPMPGRALVALARKARSGEAA